LVAILLTYGTARVLLAGDAEAKELAGHAERPLHEILNGHQRSKAQNDLSCNSAPG
jgi:hypothetical protein